MHLTEAVSPAGNIRQWALIRLPNTKKRPPHSVGLATAWLLIAVCLAGQTQTAAVLRLYPVDETDRDPAFQSFVKKLRSAVEKRSTKALRKLVDEEVVVGPAADDAGWAKFVARWRPGDGNSELWSALSELLSLGFVREHPRLFVSPYLVWRFPRDLDMATHLVVIRDNVPLHLQPSVRAPLVASLSFDIVRKLGQAKSADAMVHWIHVRTIAGQVGYLNAVDAMSPLMPRAQFGMHGGRWRLIALEGQDS